MPFSDYKTALITGASSGIGAAVVERLRRENIEVHAVARSAAALHDLAKRTGCVAHAIDVTDRAAMSARHHPAFGQITQILAHGLGTHAETIDEGGDLDASLLADEFADLEASLTGVAGRGHGVFRRVGESMPHFDIFRY